jgi:hypothetical protein
MAAYRPVERLCVHGAKKEGSTVGLKCVFAAVAAARCKYEDFNINLFGFFLHSHFLYCE